MCDLSVEPYVLNTDTHRHTHLMIWGSAFAKPLAGPSISTPAAKVATAPLLQLSIALCSAFVAPWAAE